MQDRQPRARRTGVGAAQRARPLITAQEVMVLGAAFALGLMLHLVVVLRLSAVIE